MEKQIPDTIRDRHPGFADVQVGSSEALREKAQAHCLKNAHRTFEQGIQCVQVNSMNALVSLQDTVMVIHSPLGCSGCAAFGAIDRLNVYKHHRGREPAALVVPRPESLVPVLHLEERLTLWARVPRGAAAA